MTRIVSVLWWLAFILLITGMVIKTLVAAGVLS